MIGQRNWWWPKIFDRWHTCRCACQRRNDKKCGACICGR